MATTRPVVVITTAAPWLAAFPSARDRLIAPARAFWASAWICALMLVTRSSPVVGGVWLTVPVTSGGVDRHHLGPGLAAELGVVLGLKASLADQVHTGETGHGQVPAGDLLGGDRLQVTQDLRRVGPVGLGVVDDGLNLRGDTREFRLLLHDLERHLSG